MTERRPLGLPVFSQPVAPAAADSDRPRLLSVGRVVFQAPPADALEQPDPGRPLLAADGLTFSDTDGAP